MLRIHILIFTLTETTCTAVWKSAAITRIRAILKAGTIVLTVHKVLITSVLTIGILATVKQAGIVICETMIKTLIGQSLIAKFCL